MKNFVENQNYFFEDLHLLSFGQLFLEKQRKYLHGVIFDIDNDGIFVSFNKNLPRANMIASFKLCEDIHFDDVKTRVVQRYKDRMNGIEVPSIYETSLVRANGEKIEVELNAGIIKFQNRPADLVFIRDISERFLIFSEARE